MNRRHLTILLLASVAMPGGAFAIDPSADFEHCWKATFSEQLTGIVREQGTSGGPYGYMYSYEGDFKWVGKPTAKPIASQYVYCFRRRSDQGGVLIVDGKTIELGRVGSVKLPLGMHDSAGFSYVSDRDPKDFPMLYGVFQMPGQPDTSLEIQLDRLRQITTVIANSQIGKKRSVSYMQGDTTQTAP